MQITASEILLSAYQITRDVTSATYEFILNDELIVTECIKLESALQRVIQPIKDPKMTLEGLLFELNHVRINPKLNNSHIIGLLTNAFGQIGVSVTNQPHHNSMAICYKPLGEISHNVRFYLHKEGNLVFLSPAATRPKLIYARPKT